VALFAWHLCEKVRAECAPVCPDQTPEITPASSLEALVSTTLPPQGLGHQYHSIRDRLEVLHMTDAAKYEPNFRPEAQLSALYCRFHVPDTVRVGLASRRILSVELFAALWGEPSVRS
jgi:hypothetical protein